MLVVAQLTTPVPTVISQAFTPVYGYYVADEELTVSVTVDGVSIGAATSERSDLLKVYPERCCRGFYAIYETAPEESSGTLVVRVGQTEVVRQDFAISEAARDSVRRSDASRLRKRAFVLQHLACVVCGGDLSGAGQPSRCPTCRTEFAVETRAVSAVPAGTYSIPGAINTSFCGYGNEEQKLIESARNSAGFVLDFGAGLRSESDEVLISVEIADMPSIDLVSVGDRIPFRDNTFDAAMTLHVLEHLRRPWVIAKELLRVVKPGGTILATVPYICPVHGFPHHFFSMTPAGLRSLFDDCEFVSHTMKPDAHPINGIKQLLGTFRGSIGDPAVRKAFGRVTIDEIVDGQLGTLIQAEWAQALNEAARWEMPAHSTLIVRKPESHGSTSPMSRG